MGHETLWLNTLYLETVSLVVAFLILLGVFLFVMQLRSPKWIGAWASLKSWVIATPAVFIVAGLPSPWPFVGLVLVVIYGAKTFFRMTGMYHRSWFVWHSYIFIILQAYSIHAGFDRYYDLMPMIFFSTMMLIPILRNSSQHMIQYTALSLMNLIFMGWGLLYLGRIMMWPTGIFIVLYLFILSEVCDSAMFAGNRLFGKHRPLSNISSRFSIEGFAFSIIITVLLAWGSRRMLPSSEEPYWLTAGLAICLLGRLSSLFMSTIRRDLGIKDSGVFIIGRDDILARVDKFVFVAPVVYFAYLYLQGPV